MIKSMTGYGIGETKRDGYHIIAELKTVNHRYSNIYLHIPGYLLSLEATLQRLLKKRLDRGRIDLYLKVEKDVETEAYLPQINLQLAKSYFNQLKVLEESLGFSQGVTIDTLVSLPEVLQLEERLPDEEILHELIMETVEKSLDSLIEMRCHEGGELREDLVHRLDKIQSELKEIEERSPQVIVEYSLRLRERLEEILEETPIDEDRLAMELGIIAERSCINEEVVRLKSHLGQFSLNLEKTEAVGRKLDFIAQEMYREVNTIGAKSNDSLLANHVVNIKSEIDKIREQVQNIE